MPKQYSIYINGIQVKKSPDIKSPDIKSPDIKSPDIKSPNWST